MARLLSGQAVERTDVAKVGGGAGAALTLNGASQALVAANKDRVGLLIQAQGAGGVWVALNGSVAAANQGIKVLQNVIFDLRGYSGAVNVLGTNLEVVTFLEI